MGVKVDPLRIYMGDPYPISDDITIYQPSLHDIMEYGESQFYTMLYIFIGNTTYRKLFLWDNGIDWNKLSDYELFCSMSKMLSLDATKILFGDTLDFSTFDMYSREDPDPEPEPQPEPGKKKVHAIVKNKWNHRLFERTTTFYSEQLGIEIDAPTYHKIAEVLRHMVKIFPKTEYCAGKETKDLLISEEREKLKKAEREKTGDESTLLPLISFCCNHPGFKYKRAELGDVKINEFMDSVQRLQIYESTRALLAGSMSGFCDTSKIPKSQFDFMRQITNNKS